MQLIHSNWLVKTEQENEPLGSENGSTQRPGRTQVELSWCALQSHFQARIDRGSHRQRAYVASLWTGAHRRPQTHRFETWEVPPLRSFPSHLPTSHLPWTSWSDPDPSVSSRPRTRSSATCRCESIWTIHQLHDLRGWGDLGGWKSHYRKRPHRSVTEEGSGGTRGDKMGGLARFWDNDCYDRWNDD